MGKRVVKMEVNRVGNYVVRRSGHGGWKVQGAAEATRGRWWSLNQLGEMRWEITRGCTGKAGDGRRIRRRLEAFSLEDALAQSEEWLYGEVSTPERSEDLRPSDVALAWSRTKHGVARQTMDGYDISMEVWLSWLAARGVAIWADIRPGHIQDWLEELRCQNLSRNTIRLRLVPVKQVSAWAARKWGFLDFARGFRVTDAGEDRAAKVFWSLPFVGGFLLWLRGQEAGWSVLHGYALQGLCGLRVTEVTRLLWADIDLRRGLLRIRKGKNKQSARTIPLPSLVQAILEEAFARRTGEAVIDRLSGSHKAGTYGRQFGRLLERWGKGQEMPCSDLRNTVPNAAKRGGWESYAQERYIGHRIRGTVTERNYEADVLDTMVRQFRSEVVVHIDRALARVESKWRANGEGEKVVSIRRGL